MDPAERMGDSNVVEMRCPECQDAGIECPKGYGVWHRVCSVNPEQHSLVFTTALCDQPEYEFCPYCGAGLVEPEGDDGEP